MCPPEGFIVEIVFKNIPPNKPSISGWQGSTPDSRAYSERSAERMAQKTMEEYPGSRAKPISIGDVEYIDED